MTDKQLKWHILETKELLHTPVFSVLSQTEESGTGIRGDYVAVSAPDWVVLIPVYQDQFVMVRQWRHAEENMTWEFPGGVCNPDEDPAETAKRELFEETGFRAGKITKLGRCSSNPALFKNHFTAYLAEDLEQTGEQHLDADELLNFRLMPMRQVIDSFGSEEFSHAFMGTALAFYFRHLGFVPHA